MKNTGYRISAVMLASFALAACGGGSDSADDTVFAQQTYQEVISSYENTDFPVNGESSLDGVWVSIYKVETSSLHEYFAEPGSEDIVETSLESEIEMIRIEIVSIKENPADGTLLLDKCSTEPSASYLMPLPASGIPGSIVTVVDDIVTVVDDIVIGADDIVIGDGDAGNSSLLFDVTVDESGNKDGLNGFFGGEVASIDSPTKISFLMEETSGSGGLSNFRYSSTGREVGTLIKISDSFHESIGALTVDGELRDSACFSIERIVRVEELIEDGKTFNSTQEFVGIMFNEENFLTGMIYDTTGGSGDYDDYFEAEINVYNPNEFVDPEGADGEAGYLAFTKEGPVSFAGESEVIRDSGGSVNISFDFNLM